MEKIKEKARSLLKEFKGDRYVFGTGVQGHIGTLVSELGKKVSIVADGIDKSWGEEVIQAILDSLEKSEIELAGPLITGARPNAPREDVFYIKEQLDAQNPEVVVSIGGGSTIDAVKAAIALKILGDKYPDIDEYFGMGQITEMLSATGRKLIPHVSVMAAASSAAHLTKYSNITDILSGQKMLIVDPAVTPDKALFDYSFTATQPESLTVDGALDGISHSLEVLMGIPEDQFEKVLPVSLTGIELIVKNLKKAVQYPDDLEARECIGLGTDLGGYAIMIGGTNGAHLNSFSFTDILSHGRACALMNPYYVVFFSTRISERLRKVAQVFIEAGYIDADINSLEGRELGLVLAEGMFNLSKTIGFPTMLSEVPGFTEQHVTRSLEAAKNPKLESKLRNMPVPLTPDQVDVYMGSVLEAAKTGNMSLIRNL